MVIKQVKKALGNARKISPCDRKFRKPRVWSNNELKKIAHIFEGDVLNVSAWKDEDKQKSYYRNYFISANSYYISNFKSEHKGITGLDKEIYLDLEQPTPEDLVHKFDIVFNHTTLEHVYHFQKAVTCLCEIARECVIIVVPYIQQMHGVGYGDYWRFTPQALKMMFEDRGLNLRYCSANGASRSSIYLFAVATKVNKYDDQIPYRFDLKIDVNQPIYGRKLNNVIGGNVVR